jgi:hypothetical protein
MNSNEDTSYMKISRDLQLCSLNFAIWNHFRTHVIDTIIFSLQHIF